MENAVRLLRYLCFLCGSQGMQLYPSGAGKEPSCPRCGHPVATEMDLKSGGSADH